MLEETAKRLLRVVLGLPPDTNLGPANPLEVHDPKVGSLISFEGTTTADGAPAGATLVCSDLTTKPDYDGNLVIITSGIYQGQARDINGTTLLGVVTPAANFGGVITANTIFAILPIRTVPAEVAAVEAKLDLPAADSILVATIAQVIGNKASTAIYAKDAVSDIIRYLKGLMDSQITASGVADAGSGVGLIRDAARTEVDDWWNGQTVLMLTGAAAFQKRPITDFIALTDDIIVAPNFDGAVAAGDIYVILAHYNMIVPRAADDVANALTSQVIGRKDDTALYAAAVNATLMRYVKGLITAGIAVPGAVSDAGPAITDFDTDLTEATDDHYNGMLLMFIDGPNAGQAHTIDDYVGGATNNVIFRAGDQWTDVPVNGNSFVILPSAALYAVADITAAITAAHAITDAALGTHDTDIKALLATIAGYIDDEVAAIITSQGRQLDRMVKWSAGKVQVQITAAGATVAMPTITIENLPDGATIVEAHLMFKFRMIENKYAGVNNLNGGTVALNSQVFQIQDDGGGAWADGINFVDNFFTLASETREGGDVIVGEPNVGVANVVDGNDIYNVRLLLGKADFDFINFDDCQVGLDILYSI